MKRSRLPIIEKKIIAQDTLEVTFGISEAHVDFVAGQYVRVVLPDLPKDVDPRGNGREFSIVSSPDDHTRLSVAFRVSSSAFKQALSRAHVGDMVEVEGPYGNMTLRQDGAPLVFIAGGTGIAPCISMIRWALKQKSPQKISLLYVDQSEKSAIYVPELEVLEKRHKNFTLKKAIGRMTPDIVEGFTHGEEGSYFYVSGRPEMTDSVVNMLLKAGIPERRIYFEESIAFLRADRNNLPSFIQRNLEGIFIADLRGVIQYANGGWEQLSGWKSKDVVNKLTPRAVRSGQHDRRLYDTLWSTILSGKTFRHDFINKRKDGAFYYVDEVALPYKTAAGTIIGFVTFQRDISERVKLEKQLRDLGASLASEVEKRTAQLQQKIIDLEDSSKAVNNLLEDLNEEKDQLAQEKARDETILASMGDGLIVVDKDGKITKVNDAFEELVGWKEHEVIGKALIRVLPRTDEAGSSVPDKDRSVIRVLSAHDATAAYKAAVSVQHSEDWYYIRKDGSRFPASIIIRPLVVDGRMIGAVEVFRDITKEKEADRVKNEFISIASHQLRTPVSGLNWITEALQHDSQNFNPKQKVYLNDLSALIKRLIDLVEDLLKISRIRLKIPLVTEQTSIEMLGFIKEFMKEIEPYARSKKHKIVFDDNGIGPITVESNKKSLYTVLQNLVSNAIEYSPESPSVTISLERSGDLLKFLVSDRGQVIPEEDRPHIFERFFRGEIAKKVRTEGTGLGLYIAKIIVEEMMGSIGFESEKGKDTTFWFTIPLKKG